MLAEYIVAKALGICDMKRLEWDKHDLDLDLDIDLDGVGVEVKSAAYVQTWEQTRSSVIEFAIGPAKGWDARTNTYAVSAGRSAAVYVFCLLEARTANVSTRSRSGNGRSTCCRRVFSTEEFRRRRGFGSDR